MTRARSGDGRGARRARRFGSSPARFEDVVAVRVDAPTRNPRVAVPLEILLRRGLRPSRTTPTILRAYGAFGDVGGPQFRPALLAWLERGGVFARAAVRGGGDEGEPWHRAARLESKTVSSNDLAASARWLGTHAMRTPRTSGSRERARAGRPTAWH